MRAFIFVVAALLGFSAPAAQQIIKVGASPNDGTGDSMRTAFIKANTNFVDLYGLAWTNNVKWFGAKGDGVTDDTAAFQAAILATGSGRTLWVPRGKYRISGLTITNFNFQIVGEAAFAGGTNKIYRSDGSHLIATSSKSLIRLGGDGTIILRNLELDANSISTNCLFVPINDVTADHCCFVNSLESGVYLSYGQGAAAVRTTFHDCYFAFNKFGAYIQSAVRTTFEGNCLLQENTSHGLLAVGVDEIGSTDLITVSDAQINNNVIGIEFRRGTRNANIQNCLITSNTNQNMLVKGYNQSGYIGSCFFEEPGKNSGASYFSLHFLTNSLGSGTLGPNVPQGWLVENCVFTSSNPGHGVLVEALTKSEFRNCTFQLQGIPGIQDTNAIILTTGSWTNGFFNMISSGGFPMTLQTNLYNQGISTHGVSSENYTVMRLPIFANNAAAVAGGLTVGTIYRSGGDPDAVSIVH